MGETFWYEFTMEGIVIFHWQPTEQKTVVHQLGREIADTVREFEEAHADELRAMLRSIVLP